MAKSLKNKVGEQIDSATKSNSIEIPQISLPKGGGALKNIDEKFHVNAVNGTASFSIPLPVTPGRNGFTPSIALSYNSGNGNSIFGIGWDVDFPCIQRKTDKQLPRFRDGGDLEDVFMFSGIEDLVPFLDKDSNWSPIIKTIGKYKVRQYRPRTEGSFSRIERISIEDQKGFYWKVTTKDNVVTFFGMSDSHRIVDPADSSRIYKWLPEFSFDDKGSLIQFQFKDENLDKVRNDLHERNRFNGLSIAANKHLKRIKYGNRLPFYPDYTTNPANIDEIYHTQLPAVVDYFFEIIFDYGEHVDNLVTETTVDGIAKLWNARTDAFSEYRAGFEIRTYRLCERVLMFHHFDELNVEYGAKSCLVKSLDMKYLTPVSGQQLEVAYLKAMTQTGYIRNKTDGTYRMKSLPPMEFSYQELRWNTEVKAISPENIVNAPVGLSAGYEWVDLYHEGISGILTEQANNWYYKSNLGNGEFSVGKIVAPRPSFPGISNGTLQLQDLEANGKRHAVVATDTIKGYFELSDDNEWTPFRAFEQMPTIDMRQSNAKFIDLNGDGMPDLVVSEDNVFSWYAAKGTQGYSAAEVVIKRLEEEQGPAIVFGDITQSIFLADMSGDGLTDIVRIRNGEICYWPNLGYGRFGAKVNMSHAPVFDSDDQFHPSYLHLADVSGTGATDILYLGKNKFKAWLNLSGNAWSSPCEIDPFLNMELPNQLDVIDLLGNGTSCIVWSSPSPANSSRPMQYIDLMGGRKPHIMTSHINNLGKETRVEYKSSSQFYVEDKKAGRPWVTKLPFPVQCVSKLEIIDSVADLRFTNKYTYHHGYYDHEEREFRGFGMVEQIDTEEYAYLKSVNAANASEIEFHEPPTLTKTWFHTGAYLRKNKILDHFKDEYWYKDETVSRLLTAAGVETNKIEWQLPDAEFIGQMSTAELIEAHRACKGMAFRQEIFALDGSDKEKIPFSVSTHNCHIKLLQPRNENRYAVFLGLESEAITFLYERNIRDPRISHTLNLELDEFGNVLKGVSVVYPRANEAINMTADGLHISLRSHANLFLASQGKQHILYTETKVTTDAKEKQNNAELVYYRLPVPWSVKTFEVGFVAKEFNFYRISDFEKIVSGDDLEFVDYQNELEDEAGKTQLRLIEESMTLLLSYDLKTPLQPGTHGALGMPYEGYQLAYTPTLVDYLYNTDNGGNGISPKRVTSTELVDGKFCHVLPTDQNWWIRSGTIQYMDASLGEGRDHAAKRFYLPLSYTDPFQTVTRVAYYKDYHLLLQQTTDALDNTMRVEAFEFRTLSPRIMKDSNFNLMEVAIDALGLVVGTAMKGKGTEADDLDNFAPDLSSQQIQNFFADPFSNGRSLLQHATTRLVYDFTRIPCVVGTIAREEHHAINANPKLQYRFEYTSGLGNVVMQKIQAEPGDAPHRDENGNLIRKPNGELDLQPTTHRWVGSGRTILNNKGKPVKQYEPYFSDTHRYEDEAELRETGVTPVLHYDAAGRLVRTDMPDETFSSVEYDAWMQKRSDQNDNCKKSKWYTDRVSRSIDLFLTQQGKDPVKEKEAAEKAAVHDQTPSVVYTDSLGRAFFSVAHNKFNDFSANTVKEEFYATQSILDVEGNLSRIIDARENTVMEYKYEMLGHQVFQKSMDAGERWVLNDCMGKPVFAWDSKGNRFRTVYDTLHRPVQSEFTHLPTAVTTVFEKFEYVDTKGLTNAELSAEQATNRVTKAKTHYDSAGISRLIRCDFKGNTLENSRQLCKDYKIIPDWKTPAAVQMEPEVFVVKNEFDALNRTIKVFTPHTSVIPATVISPQYNEANLLNAVSAKLRGSNEVISFVNNIDYDAKGQRMSILYGNNTVTRYSYDRFTFRLLNLLTTRNTGADKLQDLRYTYDPVGNITFIKDDALQTIFFNNQRVDPDCDYVYDSIYRLIQASGREHIANNTAPDAFDSKRTNLAHKGDGNQLQRYTQRYGYDAAGNMLFMKNVGSWGRTFTYSDDNNRLLTSPVDNEAGSVFTYAYDKHGNMTTMPHLPAIDWNFKDQLQHVSITASASNDGAGGGYYQYDASGERIRKVVEKSNVVEERIYFGGFEIFRKRRNGTLELERETLHIMDDTRRIVLIDTKIKPDHTAEAPLMRYQYSNHLGTASLELDGSAGAQIISYEEYYPFGSTSYQATDQLREVSVKRYRYTGKERDEESGLEYHSARYYAPWIARWTSVDPKGLIDGNNIYQYVGSNPISLRDQQGTNGGSGPEQPPGTTGWSISINSEGVVKFNFPKLNENISQGGTGVDLFKPSATQRYGTSGVSIFGKPNGTVAVIADPATTLANDPVLGELAARAQESTMPGDYNAFRDELNRLIREQLRSNSPGRVGEVFEIDASNNIVFKSGPFQGQNLQYAHIIERSTTNKAGAASELKTDLGNLQPVGRDFHLREEPGLLGHHEGRTSGWGENLSPSAKEGTRVAAAESAAEQGGRGLSTWGTGLGAAANSATPATTGGDGALTALRATGRAGERGLIELGLMFGIAKLAIFLLVGKSSLDDLNSPDEATRLKGALGIMSLIPVVGEGAAGALITVEIGEATMLPWYEKLYQSAVGWLQSWGIPNYR